MLFNCQLKFQVSAIIEKKALYSFKDNLIITTVTICEWCEGFPYSDWFPRESLSILQFVCLFYVQALPWTLL